jgi:hypothetical protein
MSTTTLYEATPQTGTVSTTNLTSLYSNTTNFTSGVVNSSVYSVNGGVGVTVDPTTGNVLVSIGQDVATSATPTFAGANLGLVTVGVTNDSTISTSSGELYISTSAGDSNTGNGIIHINGQIDQFSDQYVSKFTFDSSVTNDEIPVLAIYSTSTGTPAIGFGPAIEAYAELANGDIQPVGRIGWTALDMTANVEDFRCVISATKNGSAPDKKVYIDSDGNVSADGSLYLNTDQSSAIASVYANYGASQGRIAWDGTTWFVENPWQLTGSSSGYTRLVQPATGSNLSYTLPSAAGAANTVLTNDGSGVLSWALPGGGGSTFGNITIAVVDDNTIATTTGNLILGNSADGTYYPVINSGAASPVTIQRFTSATNANTRGLALNVQSSGTPAVGFGNALEFQIEAQPGNTERAGSISVISTDLTAGSEDWKMSFALQANGATNTEVAYLDSLGNFIADGYVSADAYDIDGGGAIDQTNATTSSTTPNQVAGTFSSTTTYRSFKWQVQMTRGTEYQALEIMMVHDGSTVFLNTYGDVKTGSNLATFDADISGTTIRLLATPTSATLTTYRSIVTAIIV